MLPRQPLRFVLAGDPGAGKTIMARLLIRGRQERCLVVAPGKPGGADKIKLIVSGFLLTFASSFGQTFSTDSSRER